MINYSCHAKISVNKSGSPLSKLLLANQWIFLIAISKQDSQYISSIFTKLPYGTIAISEKEIEQSRQRSPTQPLQRKASCRRRAIYLA